MCTSCVAFTPNYVLLALKSGVCCPASLQARAGARPHCARQPHWALFFVLTVCRFLLDFPLINSSTFCPCLSISYIHHISCLNKVLVMACSIIYDLKKRGREHPCLHPIFNVHVLGFSSLTIMFTADALRIPLIRLRKFPSKC